MFVASCRYQEVSVFVSADALCTFKTRAKLARVTPKLLLFSPIGPCLFTLLVML